MGAELPHPEPLQIQVCLDSTVLTKKKWLREKLSITDIEWAEGNKIIVKTQKRRNALKF